jgi:glutathione peroxidase
MISGDSDLEETLMRHFHAVLVLLLGLLAGASVHAGASGCPESLDFHMRPLADDESVHLCDLLGDKVVLVVNTASRCAYTPQYDGLEKLYQRYMDRGLVVVGFPSNDFAGQEPGAEKQIRDFCRLTYNVRFPMFEKVQVKGDAADPFYQYLARAAGEQPRWNFHKYLLDRNGRVVASFPSQVEPEDERLVGMIERLL